ncbi:hypothetical protein SNEBB_006896 [Seison nebaliae]|nr:hypothetical protein SNEBB_006896 [Seison nebaliae]
MKFDFVAFDASKVYAGNVFYYVVLYFLNPAKQSFYLHIGNVNCETMDIYSKMRNKVYFFYKRKNYVHTKSYQAVVLVSIDPILTYSSFKKRLLCRVFYDKLQDDTTYPSQWAVLQPWVATRNYSFSCIVSVDVNVVDRKLNALSEYFAKKSCFINYLDETPAACLVNYCHRDENVKITLHNSINRLNRDRAIDDIEDLFDRKNRLFSRYYRKALVHHMFMRDHAALKINKHHARNSGNQLKMINFIYFLFLSILLKNDDFFHRSIALISLIIPIENFEIGYSCDKDDTTDIIITHGKRGHHGPLIKMSYKSFRLYCVIIALITAILLLYLICLQVYYYTRLSSERIEIMDEIMEKLGMPPASFVNDDYRQPARGMSFGELNEQWNSSVTHRVEHPSDVSIERNSINRSRYPMTPDYLIDVKKSGVNSDEELHKKINDEIEEKINEEIEAKNNEIDKVDVKFEEEYATKGSEYEGHYSFPVTPNISTKALKVQRVKVEV